jgi:hypothetical protein
MLLDHVIHALAPQKKPIWEERLELRKAKAQGCRLEGNFSATRDGKLRETAQEVAEMASKD